MSKLKLKDRYKGLVVTRSDIRIGKITFDANSISEEHYQNYYDLGFTELFEVIEEEVKEEPTPQLIVEDKKEEVKETPTKPRRKKTK